MIAMGKQGEAVRQAWGEKDLFGRFEGGDFLGESGPVKSGVFAKIGDICPWVTFAGEKRLVSAEGGFGKFERLIPPWGK